MLVHAPWRRTGNTKAKIRLNDAGLDLLRSLEALESLSETYAKASPDHPFVHAVSTGMEHIRTIHGALLEVFFDL
jgi:hypothetical protein